MTSAGPPRSDSTHTVTVDEAGLRLDRWLASSERLGSRSKATQALERGRVFVDGEEQSPQQRGRLTETGQSIRIWIDRPGSASRPRFLPHQLGELTVLHEDEDIVVVDKPAGLLTVPRQGERNADTVISRLEKALDSARRRRLFVAHRIDQGTTGVVVVARHTKALDHLKAQFLARTPERHYLALVHGCPEPNRGTWKDDLLDDSRVRISRRAREGEPYTQAISHYVVTRSHRQTALIAVELVTGKRNQIRIQAALRDHPLVGEDLYVAEDFDPEITFRRPALHAARIAFKHPTTEKPVFFEAPMPSDLERLVKRLAREAKP